MAKVIVERPRHGSEDSGVVAKGYRKRVARQMADGGTPVCEGIRRPYGHHKQFNEHLGPLRRFLLSRAGRPWDTVRSELCERIDRGNVVQKHILTHVDDFVATQVVLIDGRPCHADGHWAGRPLAETAWPRWRFLYVCPKTGLLKRVPPRPKPAPDPRPQPPAFVRVGPTRVCKFLDGRWELIELAPLPDEHHRGRCRAVDVVLNRVVAGLTVEVTRPHYGAAAYAVARRVLGKRELKQYPIPFEFLG
ncbi:MAG: hypothetical protein U0871_06605 [Gemmataceae bacterium]